MLLGMSLIAFTILHVGICFAGIGSGFVVLFGMPRGNSLPRSTAVFLATTAASSATGFLFPFVHLKPSHIIGVLRSAGSRACHCSPLFLETSLCSTNIETRQLRFAKPPLRGLRPKASLRSSIDRGHRTLFGPGGPCGLGNSLSSTGRERSLREQVSASHQIPHL